MIPYISDKMLSAIQRLRQKPLAPHQLDGRTLRALERRKLVIREVKKVFAKKFVYYKLTSRGFHVYTAYMEA